MIPREPRDLEGLFEEALKNRVFSGASFAVGVGDEIISQGCFGKTSLSPSADPVNGSTFFDLASLTKPLATAMVIMELLASSEMHLEETISEIFPLGDSPEEKRGITVRQLLEHSSGLPAHKPYFRRLFATPEEHRKETLFRYIMEEPLESPPGRETVYSDLGFILLGYIIERKAGANMGSLAERFYRKHGVRELLFNPAKKPVLSGAKFAATGFAPETNKLLAGVVHDDNARASGGTAGHAGLFGTAPGVAGLLGLIYESVVGRGPLAREMVLPFVTEPLKGSGRRGLGFDVPEGESPSSGRFFSRASVGHLGFTGTSFWLDLTDGSFAVLLTNRVLTDQSGEGIKWFRPRFHDMAWGPLRPAEDLQD